MASRLVPAVLIVAVLGLAACGSTETAAKSDPSTTTAAADTAAATSTTADRSPTTDAAASDRCPEVPLPDDLESTATVAFDGDGDGEPDTLTTFQAEGKWWIGVEWAAGGSGWIPIDGDVTMGATALGGYDIDGDGTDEAFITLGGPAAGVMVHVYQQDVCGLKPTKFDNGEPFSFPVTATVGTFSSARCGEISDITLKRGVLPDPDGPGTIALEQVSYSFDRDSATMRGEEATNDDISGVDVAELMGLRCGDLNDALSAEG